MQLDFQVDGVVPRTVEVYLRREQHLSHRTLTRLKRVPNGICCNGKPVRTIDLVQPGDRITLTEPELGSGLEPVSLEVPILAETAQYLVYNKPPGMPVHPSQGHHSDTLGNVFAARCPSLPFRPVFRLDRDTSGCCLVAKSAVCAAFLQGKIQKEYEALVCGILLEPGTICAPIGRETGSVIRRCVRQDGKYAVTHFTPLEQHAGYTRLRLTLETGRTHQIRVHLAHLGYPLAGDSLYGGDTTQYPRQMLRCTCLRFPDPETGERTEIFAGGLQL